MNDEGKIRTEIFSKKKGIKNSKLDPIGSDLKYYMSLHKKQFKPFILITERPGDQ